ncbi:RING-H2 finger protein ATL46-like [Nicotiana tomentosiformis]|uniref:RING-H2 finger protein ATL46-like n=1 Tax=Nicotiana tomentosiformis TaxID=4098 RepID=UPI00051B3ADF|nr:RING-H2 finger protein ATL46-like [Nicotiana tomentosiformis]
MICSFAQVRSQRWVSGHTHLKNSWIQHKKDGVFTYPPPLFPPSPPSFGSSSNFHNEPNTSSSSNKISPAVLFIIVILAVLFFISGLLHLLVRFLIKHPSSSASSQSNGYPEVSTSDALQRQLQQLFHLHDSGLDQAFIDALPVFMYKEVVGPKEPFDCAVCLCEFSDKDKLRLLPTCSHAFHINCIDTWLLSNSTCPLCRGALYNPGFPIENPMFDFDEPREDDGYRGNADHEFSTSHKTIEIEEVAGAKATFPVRLGKFRKLDNGAGEGEGVGESSSSNLDARRCFSMGSYQYVVGDVNLKVALSSERKANNMNRANLVEKDPNPSIDEDNEGKKIGIGRKTDSYSVSKIWLWSKRGKFASSSDFQMDDRPPSSMDLPWLRRTEGM